MFKNFTFFIVKKGNGESTADIHIRLHDFQTGFVLVTLPYTMSQMGFAWGSAASVLYGLIGSWCVYLLVWLYLEFKSRVDLQGKVRQQNYIVQYHEVIGELTGRGGRKITYFYIILTLFMASIICVVAS
ncbi:hypothetical protein KC19_12G071700 [Ceratodon purpureus]|uniref:Amino acid transporter transmembrane domain-containing protein n=1 Tax=Ceratodon purpureus TaxID=3225 RepID=A0A8T0G6U2_CERPU|nr:hypothetical protein KC19_12G071700 [Ceratodon purpureus]